MAVVNQYSANPWEHRATGNQPRVRGDMASGNWFPPGDPRNNPDVIDPLTPDSVRSRDQVVADNNAQFGEGRWAFSRAKGSRPLQGMPPGTDGLIYDGETVGPDGQIIPDPNNVSQYQNLGVAPPSFSGPPQLVMPQLDWEPPVAIPYQGQPEIIHRRPDGTIQYGGYPGPVADRATGPDGQPLGGRFSPQELDYLRRLFSGGFAQNTTPDFGPDFVNRIRSAYSDALNP